MFSKKTISILGISVLGAGGAGYHYCAKKHPDRIAKIAWLDDVDCVYRKATEQKASSKDNLVKIQEDSKK